MDAVADSVPVIDLRHARAGSAIDAACRSMGFFAVSHHDVPDEWRAELIDAAASFFALDDTDKARAGLAVGGRAWRGWFPLGGELTSGVPDLKEGFYVGRDLPGDQRPMHGRNVWPAHPASLRPQMERWMAAMESLGQRILALMATGLGMPPGFFAGGLTLDPTVLFRIFRYPPHPPGTDDRWGVGEHTDYGLLTLLAHDGTPGLEVRVGDRWLAVDSDPSLIVCNLGDMLDRLTSGRYRSTPHRVRNLRSTHDRFSLPFFLDPGWSAAVEPVDIDDGWQAPLDAEARWDRANLRDVHGTYGDWLGAKVAKVFPDLAAEVLTD